MSRGIVLAALLIILSTKRGRKLRLLLDVGKQKFLESRSSKEFQSDLSEDIDVQCWDYWAECCSCLLKQLFCPQSVRLGSEKNIQGPRTFS